MKTYVIDASFCLAFLLPDEASEVVDEYFASFLFQGIVFLAPTLLPYEVANALRSAYRQKRIQYKQAEKLLNTFLDLSIPLQSVNMLDALELSRRYEISIYDAAYLALSIAQNVQLLTLDKRLKGLTPQDI